MSLHESGSISESFGLNLVELNALPESEQNILLRLLGVQDVTRRFLIPLSELVELDRALSRANGETTETDAQQSEEEQSGCEISPRLLDYAAFSGCTNELVYGHWDSRSEQTDQPLSLPVRRRVLETIVDMRRVESRLVRLKDSPEEAHEDGWEELGDIDYVLKMIRKRKGSFELRLDDEEFLATSGSCNEQSLPCSLELASDYMLTRYCKDVWLGVRRHEDILQEFRTVLYETEMNLAEFQEEVEALRSQLK